jgi:MFS family permease
VRRTGVRHDAGPVSRLAGRLARISAPLRGEPRFLRCFVADQVNAAGMTMATGALAFTVLDAGGGATGIAMVLLANMSAGIVVSPLGGVVADRLPRALIISVVQVIIGLITVAETVLIFTGRAAVWNLATLAGANSAAASFAEPARTGLVRSIVAAEQLNEANALNQLARHSVLMIGPAIGGTIVATAGAGYGVGCNAISFFASAALMARIHAPRADRQPSTFGHTDRYGSPASCDSERSLAPGSIPPMTTKPPPPPSGSACTGRGANWVPYLLDRLSATSFTHRFRVWRQSPDAPVPADHG